MTFKEELEKRIGENMGCYYRVATKQWLKEINDPITKEFRHVIDITAHIESTATSIINLVDKEVIQPDQESDHQMSHRQGKGLQRAIIREEK